MVQIDPISSLAAVFRNFTNAMTVQPQLSRTPAIPDMFDYYLTEERNYSA